MSLQVFNKQSKHSVTSVFRDVQFSISNHSSHKKILTDIFKKTKVDTFLKEFVQCLKICLLHEEKSTNVEKTLDFAADFAVSFSADLKEDETCPLLEGVFQFIFENHDCQIQLVRLRICQLMNRLLDNMGQDASVVEDTYNKIAESMLVRLKDSMTSVRTQAVYALHRLQSPSDPDCEIITAFKYHMMHDPCHEVRRAVIQKIAVTKATLASVLTRVNDVKDSVRKEAYVFINRLLIRQFTIKQRQLILESGLGDRSEMVREYVVGTLVPNWLKYFSHNYYEFLECVHVEKIPDTALNLLKQIFQKHHDIMLEARVRDMYIENQRIPYDKLNIITVIYWRALVEHVKPSDEDDKLEPIFQQVVPDLTPFCQYIRGYFFPPKSMEPSVIENVCKSPPHLQDNNASSPATVDKDATSCAGTHKPDEAVLAHLLEMCKVYDLADELGRTNLWQLCVDLLQSSAVTTQSSTAVLASLLDHAVPSVETKLSVMAELITELREPLQAHETSTVSVPDLLLMEAEEKKVELSDKIKELETEMEIAQELEDETRVMEIKELMADCRKELKILNEVTPLEPGRNVNNDPETLKKCLTIVVEVLKKGKITKMNPTLYSLMQNFVVPTLKLKIDGDSAPVIKNLALQVLGLFCVLDVELAKEHFLMFCFNIATGSLSVTALRCVFDLLHVYGLSTFNIEDPDAATMKEDAEEDRPKKPNLVVLLMSLLNSDTAEMKRTATIGLSKLLLFGRIKSAELVTKLILLWYNPDLECDPHIRQPLGVFFSTFASSSPHAPPLLLKAFMPTIQELFRLEVADPMTEVDVDNVANLLVDFTRPGYNSHEGKDQSTHNQLAIQICEAILSEEFESLQCAVLIKTLGHLELNMDLQTDIAILSALVARMVKSVSKQDKNLYRLVLRLEQTLQAQLKSNESVSTVTNTLPPETTVKSETARSSQLLIIKDSESDDEVDDEEELSQDMTTLHTIHDSDAMVIPGTPETSDSDDDQSCPSEIKFPRVSKEDEEFKGFAPQFKGFSPGFKGFKEPPAPPPQTPSDTSFKVPDRTLKRAPKTPAPETTKTPGRVTRGEANTPAKTPGRVTLSEVKTPHSEKAMVSSPEESSVNSNERVTRSGKKRKM